MQGVGLQLIEEGDAFVWKRSDRPDSEPLKAISTDQVVVDGYTAGSTVCIEVSIRRGTKVSPQPLEECFPE